MYTLDANVFQRDANTRDPDYSTCHALIEQLVTKQQRIIVPMIVLAEIAGPLRRSFGDPIRARLYADSVAILPNVTLVDVDLALGQVAADLAADYALRGMDAIYVATAQQNSTTLITLDGDVLQRARAIVPVQTPAEALADLSSSGS